MGLAGRPDWYVMIPLNSPEQLSTAVELMCYFCTAIGVALAWFFAPRA
jgi:hypothetical protein